MQEHLADEKYQMLKYLSLFKMIFVASTKIFINHSLANVEEVWNSFQPLWPSKSDALPPNN